jgi:hypothetical protein
MRLPEDEFEVLLELITQGHMEQKNKVFHEAANNPAIVRQVRDVVALRSIGQEQQTLRSINKTRNAIGRRR